MTAVGIGIGVSLGGKPNPARPSLYTYKRPGGVDKFRRPGGVYTYKRPAS